MKTLLNGEGGDTRRNEGEKVGNEEGTARELEEVATIVDGRGLDGKVHVWSSVCGEFEEPGDEGTGVGVRWRGEDDVFEVGKREEAFDEGDVVQLEGDAARFHLLRLSECEDSSSETLVAAALGEEECNVLEGEDAEIWRSRGVRDGKGGHEHEVHFFEERKVGEDGFEKFDGALVDMNESEEEFSELLESAKRSENDRDVQPLRRVDFDASN